MSGGPPPGLFNNVNGGGAPAAAFGFTPYDDYDDEADGRYAPQQAKVIGSAAQPSASGPGGASASASSAASSSPTSVQEHRIEVPIEFVVPYSNSASAKPAVKKESGEGHSVLTVTPLPDALKALGLSPNELIHIKDVHVEEHQNSTKTEFGVRINGVNGQDLNKVHVKGANAALVLWPATHTAFGHSTPKKLYASSHDASHIGVSYTPSTLLSQAAPHPQFPTKLQTQFDLSGFANPNNSEEQALAPVTELGQWLLANAGSQFKNSPNISPEVRANLPVAPANVVGDLAIAGDGFLPNVVRVLVDQQALKDGLQQFTDKQAVRPFPPSDHTVQLFRTGAKPDDHIGLLNTSQPDVSGKDVDRADKTSGAVRLRLVYTLQHNGKPYDPTAGAASVKK